MDPWGAVPGRPWLGRSGGWALELSSSQTLQIQKNFGRNQGQWGADKSFPTRATGSRTEEEQEEAAMGKALEATPGCSARALHWGPVTGRTQDSSDFLASFLSLGKGSLALWQPVSECSWPLLIL